MSEQEQSREDKFFGVKTTIGDDDAPNVEVQTDDTPPKVDVKPETPPKAQDDDDELESYSEKVQKRIKKMTWEKNEERRHREAAEKEREEAMRLAQNLLQKTRQQEQLITNGEGYLIKQIKDRAQSMLAQAQAKYRKAYEEGDTDAIIEAQNEMLNAKAEEFAAGQREQDYARRYQQWQQAQQMSQYQPPPKPEVPRPTERASQWADDNPWFHDGQHPDMQSTAFGIHERLVRLEGVRPDTDEYFNAIDREMRQRFPEYFGGEDASSRQSTSVVAPAQRNNGAKPRQIKLNQTQLSIIKRLGITPEQYAREMMKDTYNG